jgi:hydroxymethylglutaryl-CoA lyase
MQWPSRAVVYEVGPRDGLQNEARTLSADEKLALITALADAGLIRIEATSFVSPRWIPQLGDAEELVPRLPARPGLVYSALVPNPRGLERALLQPNIGTLAVFLSSSEAHNRKNLNRTIAESLRGFEEVIPAARAAGRGVRAYVSTVWGCPYEGAVDPRRALDIALELRRLGAQEISLGDTIGVGTPGQTARICELFLSRFPPELLAVHLHDTRGTALANALVALEAGITTFDSAVGGMGGCPYAPGASGNLATEDLVYMLRGLDVETGVDLEKLVEAGRLAEQVAGRELPGRYLKAAIASRRLAEAKAARAGAQVPVA